MSFCANHVHCQSATPRNRYNSVRLRLMRQSKHPVQGRHGDFIPSRTFKTKLCTRLLRNSRSSIRSSDPPIQLRLPADNDWCTYESRSEKTGHNACAQSLITDLPVQSAQSNQGRHFPPKLDFRYGGTALELKIPL
ncbi:hypothetical protein DPMN_167196 [Dreissena polymorpha]|uniref:Uncharacterized protein n=1 Tax=Dreissena polymorpha TaxID=45954 RepID=A0A9D4F0E8_DREPO|nr:hypothetical protein DPMN_167196 [Dreissena polymorpha]